MHTVCCHQLLHTYRILLTAHVSIWKREPLTMPNFFDFPNFAIFQFYIQMTDVLQKNSTNIKVRELFP